MFQTGLMSERRGLLDEREMDDIEEWGEFYQHIFDSRKTDFLQNETVTNVD